MPRAEPAPSKGSRRKRAPERLPPEVRRPQPFGSGPAPIPEVSRDQGVRKIVRPDPGKGRRSDREPNAVRVSRADREALVLETLGIFRVVARRSLVHACFDGHAFAANRVLVGLERQGVIVASTVTPPPRKGPQRSQHGYQVYTLTGRGRDIVAARRRKKKDSKTRVVAADDQRFWAGAADLRQLRHDHQVMDAVVQEADELRSKGCHLRRVRLESELRGLLAAAEHGGRKGDGEPGGRRARAECASGVGLRVFDSGVPLPDALIEIEHPDGSVSARSIEVTTGQYSVAQVSAKRDAGFRLYSFPVPSWRSSKNRKAGGPPADWQEFPLSWGR